MHKKPAAPVVPARAELGPATSHPSTGLPLGVTWLPETHPPAAHTKPSDRPILDMPKRRVFVDDVRAPARLETPESLSAVLYRDELVGLSPGERGKFFRAASPRAPIEVRLSDEPPAPWDASTSLVRFVVEPRGAQTKGADAQHGSLPALRPGDVGWLELEDRSRELLVFPESALLRSSEGPYVLVASDGERTFTRRPLQIGRILKGHVVVLSGLREDDRIVVQSAFFIDTERSREPKTEPIAGALP
jgi:multidrug efflux pump subunit AcrA (membrane-fusion protein)